jgi:hypothetical protein
MYYCIGKINLQEEYEDHEEDAVNSLAKIEPEQS